MPDLLDLAITRAGTVSLPNAPTWTITGRIVNSQDQTITLRDFTGANAVNFPQVLGQLTPEEQDEFVGHSVRFLLSKRYPGIV